MSKRHSRGRSTTEVEPSREVLGERKAHLVGKVRSHIRDLIEPWTGLEYQEIGGRQSVRRIDHAALLVQLSTPPSATTQGGSSGPGSRPPASLEAASLLGDVAKGVEAWGREVFPKAFIAGVWAAARTRLSRTIVLLAELHRRAAVMDEDDLEEFTGMVLAWWARARIVTAWDVVPLKPHVPCPECGEWDKVQVRTDPTVAVCRECNAVWDSETVFELGSAVVVAIALLKEPKVVADFIDRATRGSGRAGPNLTPSSADVLVGVGRDKEWVPVAEGLPHLKVSLVEGKPFLDYTPDAAPVAGVLTGD